MSHDRIVLGHGGGGLLTAELVRELFLPVFADERLWELGDAALLQMPSRHLAFTTDSYVVSPLFFPGGDIGTLAATGTINDLAVVGARPRYMSCSFILEEGLPISDLHRIVTSLARTARAADVAVVTGDTKVVERGRGDGVLITTTGIGELRSPLPGWGRVQPGDAILVSGTVGDHGCAILATRAGLGGEGFPVSDCAPLHDLVETVFQAQAPVHWMRDPTRGGLAAALNELVYGKAFGVSLEESSIPVSPSVRALQGLLGVDPLEAACEGRVVMVVDGKGAPDVLSLLRSHPLGSEASIIGSLEADHAGRVVLRTAAGGRRFLDMPVGEQLPRIC